MNSPVSCSENRPFWLHAWRVLAFVACAFLVEGAWAQTEESRNGLVVSVPNGYATVRVEDLRVQSTAGPVRWVRQWDGQEWKFNPHWESLSQSWRNLTGSTTADTTGSTGVSGTEGGLAGGGASGTGSGSGNWPGSGGGLANGGSVAGCWVWVDEDWTPSQGTVEVGGSEGIQLSAARSTPFNRVMGESSSDYAAPMRVSIDYATLCMGTGQAAVSQDLEGIRRLNELYLGQAGRYAFNNRVILEKRPVQAVPAAPGAGTIEPVTNEKGYRWQEKSGDWIDYNTQGQVVAYGDRNGNAVWLARDAAGVLRSIVDASGRLLYTLHYDGDLLVEVRDHPDPANPLDLPPRSVKYQYDALNRLVQVTDARNSTTRYRYDAQNRLTEITDPEGRVNKIAYNGSSVAKWITPDGAVTDYAFEYDDTNKQFVSKTTGPDTAAGRRVETLAHNRVGKLVHQVVNGRTETEVRYDTGARAEIVTNARGFTTRSTTNEFDQVVEIAYPDGGVVKRAYSALHLRMTEETDESGVKTSYQYDSKGNLVKKVEAVGSPDERITEYTRNGLGQVTHLTRKGKTEANGTVTPEATWQIEYDATGQIEKTVDPEGAVRQYLHDRAGNLVSYTDPRGNTTLHEFDAAGNLVKTTDALDRSWASAFDKAGNEISFTDARGKTTAMVYDGMNRNTRTTSPGGGVYQLQYNGQGLPISETDEDGRRWEVEYDNFQRLVKQIDGKGNVAEHSYQVADGSAAGSLGSLLFPTQTKYPTFTEQQRFDERERPTLRTVLNPTALGVEGLVSSSKYDKRGRMIEATDADGKTSYFTSFHCTHLKARRAPWHDAGRRRSR